MKRIHWIMNHPLYRSSYQRLEQLEQDRIFCRHNMTHFLDVARIAYIRNLEQQLGIAKPIIYAAALLHDIGKGKQYEEGIPHELSSADIANEILSSAPKELLFNQLERDAILGAIRNHRKLSDTPTILERLLYESDKASRNCFCCKAFAECNWSTEKKNMEIHI